MWCSLWFKWSFYAYEQCWQKSVALEIQTDSNLSDFFGFCDHRFSPYAEKIQNYFIGCGNLMLQGSSTSKNRLEIWSSVPQVCHMDKMDMEQSAHDKTVHKNMMTIAKLQQWLVSFPSTEDTNVSDGGAKTKCKSDPQPENSAIKHWQRHNGSKALSALTQPTP